jgi:hypothetical protein
MARATMSDGDVNDEGICHWELIAQLPSQRVSEIDIENESGRFAHPWRSDGLR